MSPYRTQSPDTSREAEATLIEIWRRMSPLEKVRHFKSLFAFNERLHARGIRLRHPSASDEEVRMRLRVMRLGRELVQRVYGWDPEEHGP